MAATPQPSPWFPWEKVLEFMRGVPPFDGLPTGALQAVVQSMEIAYFRRGKVVIAQGGPPAEHLFIIERGSAKVSLLRGDEEILVDVRGEGDTFGAVSLLQGKQALFQVTAREDLICYLLPAQAFKALIDTHPEVERHFGGGLARNLEAVRRSADCEMPHAAGLESLTMGAALMRSRVRELMNTEVLTCPPQTPLRQAALAMTQRQVGSIVVVEEGVHPVGLVTDTDFRLKVALRAQSFEQPVAGFMSRPPYIIGPDAYAFEALLDMSRHGVHHLVVVEDDRLTGILSDRDLQAVTGGSPVGVVREIDKVETVDGLVSLHRRIDSVLEMLLRLGGSAAEMLELVTEFNDRLTIKLLELIAQEMEADGRGRAAVPFCWMALGSEGRREQTLRTDQDNALIFAKVPPEREPDIKAWFLEFAERVTRGLERCGFPLCKGDIMASNPRWCLTEPQWMETFTKWVRDPNPVALRLATIFFDFRSLYAEADYVDNLTRHLAGNLEDHRMFLRYMAKNALYNRPPLGFLRQFVVHKDGEHKNKLNLKLSGLTPIVEGVRVLALDQAVTFTNTLERLEEVRRRGLLKDDMSADLREAFGFITLLRIRHHLEARNRGETPDNFVDPAGLNNLQRKTLKESFRVVSDFQNLLEYRYQTSLLA